MKCLDQGFPLLFGSYTEAQSCPWSLPWSHAPTMPVPSHRPSPADLSLDLLHDYRPVWQMGLLAVPGYCHHTAPLFLFRLCGRHALRHPVLPQVSLAEHLLHPDNQALTQENVKLPVRDHVHVLPKNNAASNNTEKMHVVALFKILYPTHQ